MATKTQRNAANVIIADPRWAAVRDRDASADGRYFYSVRSTGVYCRPSCPSRTARPENVRFHDTAADAEAAGFRPCRRCRPDALPAAQQRSALVARICREIEAAERPPTLAELATLAGTSCDHLARVFRRETGLTPKQYALGCRARRLRSALDTGDPVTAAIYDAGYGSGGRFYDEADRVLGMTPGAWRAGGRGEVIHHAIAPCSLGLVLVAATGRGICSIALGDDAVALRSELETRFSGARLVPADESFRSTVAGVVALIEAPRLGHGLPLDIRGTAFQRRVWQALSAVPPGATLSYAELARRVGVPEGARAVAGACAANALAVAIPCHRVLRCDGSISGYRWGVERKRELLRRERGD